MINDDVYVRPVFTVSRRGGDRRGRGGGGGGGGGRGGGDVEEDYEGEEFLDREVTLHLGSAGTFFIYLSYDVRTFISFVRIVGVGTRRTSFEDAVVRF